VSEPLAAVLAGGRGRRMGGAKATASLAGRPLIAWPVAAAQAAGLETVVVAKRGSELPSLSVPVWVEPDEPAHPLAGLVRALEAGRPVVAIGCDMPFVAPELLERLASLDGCAAPRVAGRLEPFPARYEPSALPVLRAALAREAPLREALAALEPRELDLRGLGDPALLVRSVNTPEELAAAAARLAPAPRGAAQRRPPPRSG
jgi:molybdopterin-guanine dinucleotide biosynthesis protein A